jgi:transcription elongation factor B subunit 2
MDVFLMIRRKKTTIFTDAKETTTVLEVKKMIEGILKKSAEDQRLFDKNNEIMDDSKQISEYGYLASIAKAQSPEPIGLAFKIDGREEFETLEITPLSTPPDLPDVMKGDSQSNPLSQANNESNDK